LINEITYSRARNREITNSHGVECSADVDVLTGKPMLNETTRQNEYSVTSMNSNFGKYCDYRYKICVSIKNVNWFVDTGKSITI